jgi:hypothetical protein
MWRIVFYIAGDDKGNLGESECPSSVMFEFWLSKNASGW